MPEREVPKGVRPISRAVTEILQEATEPLTIAEIVERMRPEELARSARPQSSVRSAIGGDYLIASLGGRPARYVWWPKRLQGCRLRQPLAELDFATGELPVTPEVWDALRPDHRGDYLKRTAITIELANGPTLTLREGPSGERWTSGLPPDPAFAAWCQAQGLGPNDDLILDVVDFAARRYTLTPERAADRDKEAIDARNKQLLDAALELVRGARWTVLPGELFSRLVARDFYQAAVPPGPLMATLRSDLRFVVSGLAGIALTVKVVVQSEWDSRLDPDPMDQERPDGTWLQPRSREEQLAWSQWLFDEGVEYYWDRSYLVAEAYYRAALMLDPLNADAWVHIANVRLDERLVEEALDIYVLGEAAALTRTIGDPATYRGSFWGDLDTRPYMRALHGKGLALWQLGLFSDAAAVFRQQYALNPGDDQGVRFLLPYVEAGVDYDEAAAKLEETEGFGPR